MALKHSEASGTASTKIVIAGGFGSGKTTSRRRCFGDHASCAPEGWSPMPSAGVDMLEATP